MRMLHGLKNMTKHLKITKIKLLKIRKILKTNLINKFSLLSLVRLKSITRQFKNMKADSKIQKMNMRLK